MSSSNAIIPFSLYHGTSTLFLDDIVRHGLGGKNPLVEWGVLEFSRALLPFVNSSLAGDDQWLMKVHSFGRMARQEVGGWSFQHGDTYLSPSRLTAIRYATNKRYGSELLTYAMDLLQELLNRNVPGIRDDLYQRFPHMYRFLEISPAPLLVEVAELPFEAIASDEQGRDATERMSKVLKMREDHPEMVETVCQQFNFRLETPHPSRSLRISLVCVAEWAAPGSNCTLYRLQLPAETSA